MYQRQIMWVICIYYNKDAIFYTKKRITEIPLYLWQVTRTLHRITRRIQLIDRHIINDCKKHKTVIYTRHHIKWKTDLLNKI